MLQKQTPLKQNEGILLDVSLHTVNFNQVINKLKNKESN